MAGQQRAWRGWFTSAIMIVGLVALALLPAAASARPGALDPDFGENGRVVTQTDLGSHSPAVSVAEGPQGTIVAAAGKTVFRYLSDGSLDPTFGEGGRVTVPDPEGLPFTRSDLAVDTEGHVFLIGSVEVPDIWVPVNYISRTNPTLAAVIRYTSEGQLDPTFGGGNGFLITDFGQPSPYQAGVPYSKALTRLTIGAVDRTGDLLAIVSEGEIVTHIRSELAMTPKLIVRLTSAGELDPSFGGGDGVASETGLAALGDLVQDRDGALLVSGLLGGREGEAPGEALVRLTPDGSIDKSFGRVGTSSSLLVGPLSGLAIDRFDRIVALGGRGLVRLTHSGEPDRRFGLHGRASVRLPGESSVTSLAVEPSGHILLAGTQAIQVGESKTPPYQYRRSFTVIRLNSHGKPDRRFGHRGWASTRFGKDSSAASEDAFIDADNQLVVAGTVARPDLAPTGGIALARYRLGS